MLYHSSFIVIALIHWMLQDKDVKSPSICEQKQSKMTKFFPHWTKCASDYLFIYLFTYLSIYLFTHLFIYLFTYLFLYEVGSQYIHRMHQLQDF